MGLTHKTDLAVVAKGRIVSQYRNSPLFVALIAAIAGVVQKVEDAFWDLSQAMLLDTATGVWLEYLGAIVGESREGDSDADYRRFIKARILANRSSGTIDEVLTIVALILNVSPISSAFEEAAEFYPASMLLVIDDTIVTTSDKLRRRLCRIVSRARPAGVRLLINSSDDDELHSFELGDSATVIHAVDFSGASGVVDAGGTLIVTGGTSGATGHILGTTIVGTSGTVFLTTLTGAFVNAEALTCPSSWAATSVGPSREAAVSDAAHGLNGMMGTPVISSVAQGPTFGGGLTAGTTYYYRVSGVDAFGGESLASVEASHATTFPGPDTQKLVISWGAVPGAVGYRLYGRATGAELFILQVGAVTSVTDTGLIPAVGALPGVDTATGGTGGVLISGDLA